MITVSITDQDTEHQNATDALVARHNAAAGTSLSADEWGALVLEGIIQEEARRRAVESADALRDGLLTLPFAEREQIRTYLSGLLP